MAAGARRSFSTAPKPIALIVQVEIQKDRTAAFLEAMSIDAKGSRTEEGCHTFDLLQDQSDPQKFIFYEVYKDADAIAVHRETPHCKFIAGPIHDPRTRGHKVLAAISPCAACFGSSSPFR